ncbi:MAG: hypothetical protein ACRC42_01585, partial [Mycoplasma sp.]
MIQVIIHLYKKYIIDSPSERYDTNLQRNILLDNNGKVNVKQAVISEKQKKEELLNDWENLKKKYEQLTIDYEGICSFNKDLKNLIDGYKNDIMTMENTLRINSHDIKEWNNDWKDVKNDKSNLIKEREILDIKAKMLRNDWNKKNEKIIAKDREIEQLNWKIEELVVNLQNVINDNKKKKSNYDNLIISKNININYIWITKKEDTKAFIKEDKFSKVEELSEVLSIVINIPGVPTVHVVRNVKSINDIQGIPTVTGIASVPGISSVPTVPGIPSVPSVPTVPGIPSVPSIPTVLGIPSVPGVPSVPGIPSVPSIPTVLGIPSIPGVPSVPGIPSVPGVPGVPGVPSIPGMPIGLNIPLRAQPTKQKITLPTKVKTLQWNRILLLPNQAPARPNLIWNNIKETQIDI